MQRRKERRHESSVPTGYGYHPHHAHDMTTATLRPPTLSHNGPPTPTPKAHTPILSSSPHVHTSSLPCCSTTTPRRRSKSRFPLGSRRRSTSRFPIGPCRRSPSCLLLGPRRRSPSRFTCDQPPCLSTPVTV